MSEDPDLQNRRYRWLPAIAIIAAAFTAGLPVLYMIFNHTSDPLPAARSPANLEYLYNALYAWSTEHDGRFPDNFGPLFRGEHLLTDPGPLINPRLSDSAWPPPESSATTEELVRWANNNAHYVLITPNEGQDHPDDQPLMYERLHPSLEKGINICFGDGHVKFFRWPRAIELLGQAGEPVPEWARRRAEGASDGP